MIQNLNQEEFLELVLSPNVESLSISDEELLEYLDLFPEILG